MRKTLAILLLIPTLALAKGESTTTTTLPANGQSTAQPVDAPEADGWRIYAQALQLQMARERLQAGEQELREEILGVARGLGLDPAQYRYDLDARKFVPQGAQ